MSFGEKRPKGDKRGPPAAAGSHELWPKTLRKLGFWRPDSAGETIRTGDNGGEEGIRTLDTIYHRITV
jgi:hypothetical protein